ncbi:glutathione S-transferase [Nitrobacteraceae bacterium AZCC 2146]
MSDLRVLTYLPSPRLWKATIAARLCGIDVEVRGDRDVALKDWLWDFDARPLEPAEREPSAGFAREARKGFSGGVLFKTDAFLKAHPFGTVPAAFSPDGRIGVFESNSIMRLVARLGEANFPLYGRDPFEASRIDGFLDASLGFANETQRYLLSLRDDTVTTDIHDRTADAFAGYMSGIDRALATGGLNIVSGDLSLADICFVCELALLSGERRSHAALARIGRPSIFATKIDAVYPYAFVHFNRLLDHPAFAPDLGPYVITAGLRPHAP